MLSGSQKCIQKVKVFYFLHTAVGNSLRQPSKSSHGAQVVASWRAVGEISLPTPREHIADGPSVSFSTRTTHLAQEAQHDERPETRWGTRAARGLSAACAQHEGREARVAPRRSRTLASAAAGWQADSDQCGCERVRTHLVIAEDVEELVR